MNQPRRILVWIGGTACTTEHAVEGVRLALALCAAGHAVELLCAGAAVRCLDMASGPARLHDYLEALRRETDALWVVREDVAAQGLTPARLAGGVRLLARAEVAARLRDCDVSIPF